MRHCESDSDNSLSKILFRRQLSLHENRCCSGLPSGSPDMLGCISTWSGHSIGSGRNSCYGAMCWLENRYLSLQWYFQQRVHLLFSSNISRCLMRDLGFPFRRLAICGGLSYAIETTMTTVNLKHQTHHRVQGLGLPWFSEKQTNKQNPSRS